MNARVTKEDVMNAFEYKRAAVKITAYGKDYELPVRTTEFCDKQDSIDRDFADTTKMRTSVEIAETLRKGIALFLGDDETERIFPIDKIQELDIDEITVFYNFLKDKSLQNFYDYTKKYSPARARNFR